MIIFFIIAGAALVLLGNNMTRSARRFKKYLAIIVNQNMTSIDNIAAASAVTYDTAKKDIQNMIDKGYFSGAYINDGTRELVLPQYEHRESAAMDNYEQHLETKVVACRSCGANNTVIVGRTSECEFCGSPIN
jgi:DeoR/GlpR family transcriptional regulator of sugar metabolism